MRISRSSSPYLKAHYPLEFMSALLTSETGNTDKVVKYINECREMGIKVLPPDVNTSEFTFTPVTTGEAQGIRFGLGAIKNVGQAAVESIVNARADGRTVRLAVRFLRARRSGRGQPAHDRELHQSRRDGYAEGTRAQLFAAIDSAMETGARAWRDRASGQSGLFAALMEETAPADHPLAESPGLDAARKS